MIRYVPGQPITVETLEWALDRMAVIMAEAPEQGITYLPIWQRLERERDALLVQNDSMAAVRARQEKLAATTKCGSVGNCDTLLMASA